MTKTDEETIGFSEVVRDESFPSDKWSCHTCGCMVGFWSDNLSSGRRQWIKTWLCRSSFAMEFACEDCANDDIDDPGF